MIRGFRGWALAILLLALALRSLAISADWRGHHEGSGAMNGAIARNLVRYGFWDARGAMILGGGRDLPPEWRRYYGHQPPLTAWVNALSVASLGETTFAVRLPSILLSAGSVWLLIGLVRKAAGDLAGLVAGFLQATFPVCVYYGQNPNFEALTIFAMLAATRAYAAWLETGARRWLALLLLFQAVGCHAGWPAYFLPVGFLLHAFLVAGSRARWMLLPVAMNFVHFGLFLLHLGLLPGGADIVHELLFRALPERTQTGGAGPGFWQAQRQIAMQMRFWVQNLVGVVPAVLMFLGAWLVWRRREGRRWSVLLVPLVPFLLNTTVFADGISAEEHHTEFIAPTAASLAALAVVGFRFWSTGGLVFLALLHAAQSGWRIHNRFTVREGWPVEYCLAQSIRDVAAPGEGCLVLMQDGFGYMIGWYADRDFLFARNPEEVRDILGRYPGRFRWAVSADPERLQHEYPEVLGRSTRDTWGRPKLRINDLAYLRVHGFFPDGTARALLSVTAPPRYHKGFLFYDLAPPPGTR